MSRVKMPACSPKSLSLASLQNPLDSVFDVRVLIDDAGCVPTELQDDFLFPGFRFQRPADTGEPVKLSSFRRSSVVNRSAPSREHGEMENAPFGRSVSAKTSPMINAPKGVRLAGFNTNGQPTASAGATLCAARFNGKLNGLTNEHGPMGTLPQIFGGAKRGWGGGETRKVLAVGRGRPSPENSRKARSPTLPAPPGG